MRPLWIGMLGLAALVSFGDAPRRAVSAPVDVEVGLTAALSAVFSPGAVTHLTSLWYSPSGSAPTTRQVKLIIPPISGSNLPSAVSIALIGQADPFTAIENHPAFINWINADEHLGAYCRDTGFYEGHDNVGILAHPAPICQNSPMDVWLRMKGTLGKEVVILPVGEDGSIRLRTGDTLGKKVTIYRALKQDGSTQAWMEVEPLASP